MSEMPAHRNLPECSGDAAAYILGALTPEETDAFERHLKTCVVCQDELVAFSDVVDVLPLTTAQYAAPRGLRRRVRRAARVRPERARPRRTFTIAAGALAAAAAAVIAVLALTGGRSPARTIQASVLGPGRAHVRMADGHAELVLRGVPAPPTGDVYEVWLQRGSAAPQPTRTLFAVTAEGSADVGVAGTMAGVSRMLVTPERAGGSTHPTHAPIIVARLT